MTILLTMAWLAILGQTAHPQAAEPRPGVIAGRITDQETGAPVARMTVRLSSVNGDRQYVTTSADDGYFSLSNMPPGEYRGIVTGSQSRSRYLTEPIRDASGPSTIVVKEGEAGRVISITLRRALSVTVRVVDERGDPLSKIGVEVKSLETGMSVWFPHFRTTDDRGRLRVFGLAPGRYTICAETNPLDVQTDTKSARRERFLRTCYPGADDDAKAAAVRVTQPDLEELEIRMRRGRLVTVSGVVVDASGAPVSVPFGVMLSHYFMNGGGSRSLPVGADGRFRMNVAPGDYAMEGSIGGPQRPEQRRDLEVAYLPLHLEGADIDDVVVRMVKAVEVRGQFKFEDLTGAAPQAPGSGLMVFARLADDNVPGQGSTRSTNADKSGAFTLEHMFGRRILDVANVPQGWFVKSIRHGDSEIASTPSDFTGTTDPIEVILSRRGATIAGTVVDDAGRPTAGARVIVFAADRTRWTVNYPQTARSSGAGAYRVGPVRGGDYFVAALAAGTPEPYPRDRDRFAQLAAVAEHITLGDEEQRTLDLRVVTPK